MMQEYCIYISPLHQLVSFNLQVDIIFHNYTEVAVIYILQNDVSYKLRKLYCTFLKNKSFVVKSTMCLLIIITSTNQGGGYKR